MAPDAPLVLPRRIGPGLFPAGDSPGHDEPRSIAGGRGRAAGRVAGGGARRTQVHLPFAGQVTTPSDPGQTAQCQGGVPPEDRLRVVGSLTFALDYYLPSTTHGAGEQFVLWGTRDGGRTRTRFGSDPDGRSPLAVTVGEEGVYGPGLRGSRRDARRTIAAERTDGGCLGCGTAC